MYERDRQRLDRFLKTIQPDSEFFGLLGRGYPDSFYKVFVRARPTSRWVTVEADHMPTGRAPDPVRKQIGRAEKSRFDVMSVWGGPEIMRAFTHMPGVCLDALHARVVELIGPGDPTPTKRVEVEMEGARVAAIVAALKDEWAHGNFEPHDTIDVVAFVLAQSGREVVGPW